MKRRIKFPLILKNDEEARTIEELRENFDLDRVISYYMNGKLQRWLKDRNLYDELEKLEKISTNNKDFSKELYSIFNIKNEEKYVNIEKLKEENMKVSKLSIYLEPDEIEKIIDNVVFNQNELNKKLSPQNKLIYLYEGEYNIPIGVKNKKYIGIGEVINNIDSCEDKIDFNKVNIVFENITLKAEKKIKILSKESKNLKIKGDIELKRNDYEDFEISLKLDEISKKESEYEWANTCLYKNRKYYTSHLYRMKGKEKEIIVDGTINVAAYFLYGEKIYYIASVNDADTNQNKKSIFSVNIDGSENKQIINLDEMRYFYSLEDISYKDNKNFIGVTENSIYWKNSVAGLTSSSNGYSGIYRCNHYGSKIEKIVSSNRIEKVILTNNKLIYVDSSDLYEYDINKDKIKELDNNVDVFTKFENILFYVKKKDCTTHIIYKMDINTNKKEILEEFYTKDYIIRMEADDSYLTYYAKDSRVYNDRNERKYKFNLKDKTTVYIEDIKVEEKTIDESVDEFMNSLCRDLGLTEFLK